MRFLGEEGAIEHRRFQHGYLQAADQRLDAVRKITRLENEIEQHRHQLDGHCLELIGAFADRRLLQIAQDVVHVLLKAAHVQRHAAKIEPRLAMLQAAQCFAQLGRDQNALAVHLAQLRSGAGACAGAKAERARRKPAAHRRRPAAIQGRHLNSTRR